ncbi:MAG: DGQHR domain-containing protein [Acidobacteriia bacterium]|nr:DGQHR domain-containing protein [Terriglobia bacterium]
MSPTQLKDAYLKREVKEVIENCRLDNLIVDREVQVNINGDKDDSGNLLTEKEIDVVAKFNYGGKKILLLFECEDSDRATGIKKNYKDYDTDIKSIQRNLEKINVVHSADDQLKSRHFKDVDIIKVCFVYGRDFSENSYQIANKEAARYRFLVWNYLGLTYYRRVSGILGRWSKYELFKDFSLELENVNTFTIKALEIQQKEETMYLGKIHPGQLLKIAYVVRRASEKKYAYQRMLNKDRINAIAEFISSKDAQSFLPNTVLIVFDSDPKIARELKYDPDKHELTIPQIYCSAWIIDGQHRAYGFLGTIFEDWTNEKFEPFDLPVVIFKELNEVTQTQTFININYYQKRIKAALLCDLTTLTKDLQHKLTWTSLLGRELNYSHTSPLKNRIKVSELHAGRPIGLSSLVQYGLLETLLGFRQSTASYSGPLFEYARFDRSLPFDSAVNQAAFRRQVHLLVRFLKGVQVNTQTGDPKTDPWQNASDYSLLRPTGINALFMLLAKILQKHPDGGVDFDALLKPLELVSFKRDYVAKKGGGWKGFRGFANTMIRKMNKGKAKKNRLGRYGKKEKL